MKLIKTEDAVGHVICHDITQIIKGVTKDAIFRKGHIVREEDIPVLLSVGKENLYVWEKQEGMLHEDEAAEILRQICQGEHMHPSGVKEGKIELIADCDTNPPNRRTRNDIYRSSDHRQRQHEHGAAHRYQRSRHLLDAGRSRLFGRPYRHRAG